MTHQCIRCGNIYENSDSSILRGCNCGSSFFAYIKSQKDAEKLKKIEEELEEHHTSLEREIEKEVEKIDTPFGIETVKIPQEGVYEINIDALMKNQPLIVLKKDQTYLIHLSSVFEKVRARR